MSKLNIDQQTIMQLFSDKKSDFLIPDYQRPYAWGENECQTLWDDIFTFAFPDNNSDNFNSTTDEYFLGPIVTFKNSNGKLEVIDGQQRLTTLMLLLRAFYAKLLKMEDANSVKTRETIERCIWKTDEFGTPKKDQLKIDSEVSADDDKDEFMTILEKGTVEKSMKSLYATNFQFFEGKIRNFIDCFPTYFAYLPNRILNNCILLPIEAESQDTALRIFSTLNDRGKPLADTDIFKAQLYKYYTAKGEKDNFISCWKALETICEKVFRTTIGAPLDELFTRYMYYLRAKDGIKSTTTDALRRFYEKNGYSILKNDETMKDLAILADFWNDIEEQSAQAFSEENLKLLFILKYAPNGMWAYFLSVYFMTNKDDDGHLDQDKLSAFLNKSIAFIWAYAIIRPGVNALRTPVYPEMISIVHGDDISFKDYLLDEREVSTAIENYVFSNGRPITKSMLTWWMYKHKDQPLISRTQKLEIEHIFPRKRQENEKTLQDNNSIEKLGNKALLEEEINIRASDYRFTDKLKYYKGFTSGKGKVSKETKDIELLSLAKTLSDYTESDIINRTKKIFDGFIAFVKGNNLFK